MKKLPNKGVVKVTTQEQYYKVRLVLDVYYPKFYDFELFVNDPRQNFYVYWHKIVCVIHSDSLQFDSFFNLGYEKMEIKELMEY